MSLTPEQRRALKELYPDGCRVDDARRWPAFDALIGQGLARIGWQSPRGTLRGYELTPAGRAALEAEG